MAHDFLQDFTKPSSQKLWKFQGEFFKEHLGQFCPERSLHLLSFCRNNTASAEIAVGFAFLNMCQSPSNSDACPLAPLKKTKI